VRQVRRDIARIKTVAAQKRARVNSPAAKPQDKPATKPKRATRSKSKSE